MPWRRTKDPYPVWLSEIILQQTRVNQGLPYWERFMEEFPSISDLANSSEEKVLRLWQGLGYYSRARNLHATAKFINNSLNGAFPSSYEEILKLKGIGPYTAAAISSICFDEPRPVVDGNVFRFASRYFGIDKDITSSGTRRIFEQVLADHIDGNHPGTFNQAMMEFGATLCSPSPSCTECAFQTDCYANMKNMQLRLPVKNKKTKVRDRFFNYLVLKCEDRYFLNERRGGDVWQGLYDFYLIEGDLSEEDVMEKMRDRLGLDSFVLEGIMEPVVHILSHQKIKATFFNVEVDYKSTTELIQKTSLNAYSIEEILNLPKPKLIVNYLDRVGIK